MSSKSDIQSAIRELQLGDDNDPEDILDQHLSRVLSDRNSCRSPGLSSPRQFSPPRNRYDFIYIFFIEFIFKINY